MKKLMTLVLMMFTIMFTVSAQGADEAAAADDSLKIGISKLMAHPALDSIENAIIEYITETGINAEFETQNANGEISTAASIAQLFKDEGKDIVVGIATPTAQALANVFDDIPVVYATVTDPEEAGLTGLPNVCGTSDMVPVAVHLDLIEEITKADTVGMVYTSSEANGITLMEAMKSACAEKGVELVTASVSNSAEVRQAAESIINRVDAMYVATDNTVISAIASLSTDNTVISAIASLSDVCAAHSIPLFSADVTSASGTQVLIAGGFDYYQSGLLTGQVIERILNGESPEEIGVVYLENLELYINLDEAERLGITIPESITADAKYIVRNGQELTL